MNFIKLCSFKCKDNLLKILTCFIDLYSTNGTLNNLLVYVESMPTWSGRIKIILKHYVIVIIKKNFK